MNTNMDLHNQKLTEQSVDQLNLHINAGLKMPGIAEGHRVRGMMNAAARKQLGERLTLNAGMPLWPASFFQLDNADVFLAASEKLQQEMIALCSRSLVEEALLIEKCGMAFGVKMSALSECVEERIFYNLMAAEEAIHYHQVRQFLPNEGKDVAPNAFHKLLAGLIEDGDRDSLVFIIQVVLEGWGLSHYKVMADNCLSQEYAGELKEILKDESRHHGTGVIFSKERMFNDSSVNNIVNVLVEFLQMIQVGPQSIVGAVESTIGALDKTEKIKLLQQLDGENQSATKLNTLRELMLQNGGSEIVDRLDALNSFTPFPLENCL